MKILKIKTCILLICMCYLSCKSKEVKAADIETNDTLVTGVTNLSTDSSNLAKTWLIEAIETYFAEFDKINGDYSSLCTPEYKEFKEDATNVDMDGGMDEKGFGEKWGEESIELAGLGEGFLIGGNDFGKIRVKKADFVERTEQGGFLFNVIIEDTQFESIFKREILVVPSGNSFLIDNVFELENVFKEE